MPPARLWDRLEVTAFEYYCSRGMPPHLVADFIFRKCGKSSKPRQREVLARLTEPLFDTKKRTWVLPHVNGVIVQSNTNQNITWEEFLEKMAFDEEEKADLEKKGLLKHIETAKKVQDPLVTQVLLNLASKSGCHPGKMTMSATLPGPDQSLLARCAAAIDAFYTEYSRISGDTSGVGGDYGSSPYSSTVRGPGYSAGTSSEHASADSKYLSSKQPDYSTTRFMSPPPWKGDPMDDSKQVASNPQPQHRQTSQLPLRTSIRSRRRLPAEQPEHYDAEDEEEVYNLPKRRNTDQDRAGDQPAAKKRTRGDRKRRQ